MNQGLVAATIGIGAGAVTQLVIFAALWGSLRTKVDSLEERVKLIPCLKPNCRGFHFAYEKESNS